MRPVSITVLAAALGGIAVGLIGGALELAGPAWIAALLVGLLLVGLVDRQRFYGAGATPRPRRHC